MMLGDLGFTGTRKGFANEKQKHSLIRAISFFNMITRNAHHGDCLGGDAEFHYLVRKLCKNKSIHIHPPINSKDRAWCTGDITFPKKDYLARNKDIVDASEYLIALSGDDEEVLRSGTWSTVRYARKKNKKISIIYPNGDIVDENY